MIGYRVIWSEEAAAARDALEQPLRAELDTLSEQISHDPEAPGTISLLGDPSLRQALTEHGVVLTYYVIKGIEFIMSLQVFTARAMYDSDGA